MDKPSQEALDLASEQLLGKPPELIIASRWWGTKYILSYDEAEKWHLKAAARLARSVNIKDKVQQKKHLDQADMNRKWAWRQHRGILDIFKAGEPDHG